MVRLKGRFIEENYVMRAPNQPEAYAKAAKRMGIHLAFFLNLRIFNLVPSFGGGSTIAQQLQYLLALQQQQQPESMDTGWSRIEIN